jgi:hypothetical protein
MVLSSEDIPLQRGGETMRKYRTINITNEVWDLIKAEGKFGETTSTVLLRLIQRPPVETAQPKKKKRERPRKGGD